MNPDLYQLFTQ